MKKTKHFLMASMVSIVGGTTSVFSSPMIPVIPGQEEEPRPLLTASTPAAIPMSTYVVDVNRIVDRMAEQGSIDRVYVNITPGKVIDGYGSNFKGELSHNIDSYSDTSVDESHSQTSRGKSKFGVSFKGLDVSGSGGSKSSSQNTRHTTNIQDHQNHLMRTREEDVAFCRLIQQPGLTLEITCAPKNTSVLPSLPTRSLEQIRFDRLNLPPIGSSQAVGDSQTKISSFEDIEAKQELAKALLGF